MKVFNLINSSFENMKDLKKYADEVQDEIDMVVNNFEKNKVEVNGRYFFEFNPKFRISSIVASILSSDYINKTIILARDNGIYYTFSARRQDGKEDVNILLQNLIKGLEKADGGGHIKAAGGHVLLEDKEKFKKRLEEA